MKLKKAKGDTKKIKGGQGKVRYKPILTSDMVYNRLMSMWQGEFDGGEDFFTTNLSTMPGPPGSRADIAGSGLDLKRGRDLDAECGYPTDDPSVWDYKTLFERHDIASNVVTGFADECWLTSPELYETEDPKLTPCEKAWNALLESERTNPWYYLHKLDQRCGIGECGIILLGFDDVGSEGRRFSSPVAGYKFPEGMIAPRRGRPAKPRQNRLLYQRVFDQSEFDIAKFDENEDSPRYGQPVLYNIRLGDPSEHDNAGATEPSEDFLVHWTRVFHQASDGGEVFGPPRMKKVYNRLLDLRKILGGSAEMFWKGGFPGFAFEVFPELTQSAITVVNKQQLKDEMAAYQAGLQRFLSAVGGAWKSLAPNVADPSPHVQQHLLMIAAAIKQPMRVLLGSEAGHLASEQDDTTWGRRVAGRCNLLLTPRVILPYARHLQACGVLPESKQLKVAWRDRDSLNAKDRAEVALKLTQALLQYVSSGAEKIFTLYDYLTVIWAFDPELAKSVADRAKANKQLMTKEVWQSNVQNSPANGPGKNPAKKTGAGGNRNGLGGKKVKK